MHIYVHFFIRQPFWDMSSLWGLDISPLSDLGFPRVFSPSCGLSSLPCWCPLQCPPPGNLPFPGIEPAFLMRPALAGGLFTTDATWEDTLMVSFEAQSVFHFFVSYIYIHTYIYVFLLLLLPLRLVLLVSSQKLLPKPWSWMYTPKFCSSRSQFSLLHLGLWSIWRRLCVWCEVWGGVYPSFFCAWIPTCPSTVCGRDGSLSMDCLGTLSGVWPYEGLFLNSPFYYKDMFTLFTF